MKKNNEFFVFLPIIIITVSISIFCIISFIILFVLQGGIWDNSWLIPLILIGLSLTFCIISLYIGGSKINISELGITKKRFGKKVKFFSWKEITSIKFISTNPLNQWIYFSNKERTYQNIDAMRFSKNTIYFYANDYALSLLNKYCIAEHLIEDKNMILSKRQGNL